MTPGDTSATVTWTTDEPATSRVDYGTGAAYGSESSSSALVTSHSRSLTGLTPGTTYHYAVTSADAAGLPSSTSDATFATSTPPPPASAIGADDFNRCVIPGGPWTLVNPVGDGGLDIAGAGTAAAAMRISVPAGVSHDAWAPTNRSVRIMQAVADEDFSIEAKFDSPLAAKNQDQGFIVEQNGSNWLRFDVYNDGTGLRGSPDRSSAGPRPPASTRRSRRARRSGSG